MSAPGTVISDTDVANHLHWVDRIRRIGADFGKDSGHLADEVRARTGAAGIDALVALVRLCGAIPESYNHDSSEEKLYSKYTDLLVAMSFEAIGLEASVLTERADAADVEVIGAGLAFVADAKAFRLSRTAKNQKDFKVQAMKAWKGEHPHAIVICPSYQLPSTKSQIYRQAADSKVCVLTYSHLCLLIRLAQLKGDLEAQAVLKAIFDVIDRMPPSDDARSYWGSVNRAMKAASVDLSSLWDSEVQASADSITYAKRHALEELDIVRARVLAYTHAEAVAELIDKHNLDGKRDTVEKVEASELFGHD